MRRLLIAIAVILLVSACSKQAGVRLAEAEVPAFQDQLDNGKFGEIYDASGPELKAQVDREQFITFLSAVHRKLGDMKGLVPSGWNQTVSTSGEYVQLRYDCNFEEGKAVEQFAYHIKDGKAYLVGYTVNSMALITK